MSTIRPLATIAILGCLGLFLAHQINQSPVEEGEELTANWGGGEAPAYDPAASTPPPAADAAAAPPLEAATYAAEPAPPFGAPQTSTTQPGMPPLPALPADAPAPITSAPTTQPSEPFAGLPPVVTAPLVTGPMDDIPLPDDIPEANLNGLPEADLPTSPLAGLPPAAPQASQPPASDPYESYEPYSQTPIEPADSADIMPDMPTHEPTYQSLGQIGGPAEPSFQEAITAINQALARDELTRAHAMLSAWYGDPGLSPAQREEVDALLSQLAGTVVYSTDHRLEPPYTVKPGDTLESIAQEYGVPWRLLAKINGVPNATAIQAGQTLKVLRGPFQAVVDATNNELVLMIDGKYAGKFPVQLSGAAASEGQWRVDQKPAGPESAYGASSAGKQLVLKDASGMATIVIGTSGGSPLERGRVTVAAADLDELHDILSVGSQVAIRR